MRTSIRGTCNVFRQRRRNRRGRLVQAAVWTIEIALPGMAIERIASGVRDKRAALALAQELYTRMEREAAGLAVPVDELRQAGRTIEEHLQAFVAEGGARGNAGPDHLYNMARCIRRWCRESGAVMPRDITAERFNLWRREREDLSSRTIDRHAADLRTLVRYMQRAGGLPRGADPLEHVGRDTRAIVRRRRRALTPEQQGRLLDTVAGLGPDGLERARCYRMAIVYALRRADLEAMRWGWLELVEGGGLRLRVPAAGQKGRRESVFPVPAGIEAMLREMWAEGVGGVGGGGEARVVGGVGGAIRKRWGAWAGAGLGAERWALAPVLRRVPTVEELKADLERAGVPFVDASGRRVDLHGLRHTGITNAARAGVARRAASAYARHTDPKLTDQVYTDAETLDVGGVVEAVERQVNAFSGGLAAGRGGRAGGKRGQTGGKGGGEGASEWGREGGAQTGAQSSRAARAGKSGVERRDREPGNAREDAGNAGALVRVEVLRAEGREAGDLGFEPRLTDPESVVLPLHQSPITRNRRADRHAGKPGG